MHERMTDCNMALDTRLCMITFTNMCLIVRYQANPYLHVEASPEEIEAAKEKDELVKPKSDYYLQPLLMSNKLHG